MEKTSKTNGTSSEKTHALEDLGENEKKKRLLVERTIRQARPDSHLPSYVRAKLRGFVGRQCERAARRWSRAGYSNHDLQGSHDGRPDCGNGSRRAVAEQSESLERVSYAPFDLSRASGCQSRLSRSSAAWDRVCCGGFADRSANSFGSDSDAGLCAAGGIWNAVN